MTSYAQFGTDLAILGLFDPGFVGTYLDVGAHHPVAGSNTYLLYERGWRGATVEPTLSNFERQRSARPGDLQLHAAASDSCGTATFYEADETSVSTLCPGEAAARAKAGQGMTPREVRVLTVNAIVSEIYHDAPGRPWVPDVLSVDVEGHERQVLLGCPWGDGWRPRVVVLEACYPCTDTPCDHLWADLLDAAGYRHAATCGVNRLYRCVHGL